MKMGVLMSHNTVYYIFIYLYLISFSGANQSVWECSVQDECAELEGGECTQGYCVCPVGMMMNSDNTACIPGNTSPYLFSPCEESKECSRLVTGFECHEETKRCVCREGHHYLSGRCWMSAGFSESCVVSSQCNDPLQPLSMECREGVCVCKDSYYWREPGQCRKKATALGEKCILDEDCKIESTPQAVCNLRSLTCVEPDEETEGNAAFDRSRYTISTFSISVNNSRMLDEKECFINSDCSSMGPAFCSASRLCLCTQGYYPSEDGTKCVAELGTKNPLEGTCTGFSATVEDDVCTCPPGYFFDVPYRHCRKPSRQLGESCLDDISCRTFGLSSFCAEDELGLRYCTCDETKSKPNLERQFCEPFVTFIGEPCESDENCPSTAKCIEEICSCTDETIPNPTMVECLPSGLGLGDDCVSSEQCTGTNNATCTNRKCTCKEGYLEDEEVGGFCITGIGGDCESNIDCSITNSECAEYNVTSESTEKQCRCISGYIDEDNKCYKLAQNIWEECQVNTQCYELGDGNTVACSNGICSCLPRMHFRDGRCLERKSLNEVCSSTSQCYIVGNVSKSECRNSLCQCIPGFRATYNPDNCNSAITMNSLSWFILLVIATFTYFAH